MLQIFSVILLVLSVLVTTVPFVIWWRTSVLKHFFTLGKIKKEVSGWLILSCKIILIIILGIIFIFTFPSKAMLYPVKCALFSAILVAINIILAFTIFGDYKEKENCNEKAFDFTMFAYIVCAFLVISGNVIASEYVEKDLPPVQEVKNLPITNIDDDYVYYLDEGGNPASIKLDDEVIIQYVTEFDSSHYIEESNISLTYMRIITADQKGYLKQKCITERYINKFDKVREIYYKEPYYEYEVHIPKEVAK